MKDTVKKRRLLCSLNGAVAASIKLVQNYYLTQFILQTRAVHFKITQFINTNRGHFTV